MSGLIVVGVLVVGVPWVIGVLFLRRWCSQLQWWTMGLENVAKNRVTVVEGRRKSWD